MTTNQIAYNQHLEDRRHNLIAEAETKRANLAKESENYRTNVANEAIKTRSNELAAEKNRNDAIIGGINAGANTLKAVSNLGPLWGLQL